MAILNERAPGVPEPLATVVAGMSKRVDRLPARLAHGRAFLLAYQRTTVAVGRAIDAGFFEDADWVERWDLAFADLYFTALDAELDPGLAGDGRVPRPWRLAFTAPAGLPPLRHVLLGINAHVNYDLPQALLAVIHDEDFTDRALMDRRHRDHERISRILVSRVAAEDGELTAPGSRTLLDRALMPLNRQGSKRFLSEARRKVWHNTLELQQARVAGPAEYAVRLAELELLSAAKIADLLEPGQVVLRLAVAGFGITLPPPG